MIQKRTPMIYEDFVPYFKVEGGNLISLYNSRSRKIGSIVGCKHNEGYLTCLHKGKTYKVHRIIYLLTHKTCPYIVDHINGIKDDNRPENLRPASLSDNSCNSVHRVNNTSGVKGIHKLKDGSGYQASITRQRKRTFLGLFKTIEEAKKCIESARKTMHGEFANTGVSV